jgi:DNA modification methylase
MSHTDNHLANTSPDDVASTAFREDGALFPDSYLSTANPVVARATLFPVLVFDRFRETQKARVGPQLTLRPGDVIEYIGQHREEYRLIVAIIEPEQQSSSGGTRPDIITYSSNLEDYLLVSAEDIGQAEPHTVESDQSAQTAVPGITIDEEAFAVHKDAGQTLDAGPEQQAVDDVTKPPLPDFDSGGDPYDPSGLSPPDSDVAEAYPFPDHRYKLQPEVVRPNPDPVTIDDWTGTIQEGDALRSCARLPANSVHGWVTSPPYYRQRDYDDPDQLGQESTVDEYLISLLTLIDELMRVTRPEGTGWLVIDDCYLDGGLAGIPERLHEVVRDAGYEVLHNAPWTKPNPKPEPNTNRYTHSHEQVLVIAHSGTDTWFDKQQVSDPRDVFDTPVGQTGANESLPEGTSHDAVFPLDLPKRIIKSAIPTAVCPACGAPHEPVYEVTDIRNLPDDRDQADRALELAEQHDLTDNHLRALRSVGLSGTGQAKRTQDGAGKNAADTAALAAEAREALGSYAREFTQAQKERTGHEPTCTCPTDESADTQPGIVLDPFAGTGTTLLAAKQLRRRWIGIELNPEYVAGAQSRIGVSVNDPERLTENDQQTLTSY